MAYQIATTQDRITGAGSAALLVALIGYGLVTGLGVDFPRRIAEDLKVVALLPDPPPPKPDPVLPPKHAEKRKEAAASAPNLKSKATEVVAPPPPIVLRQPPPIPVAPVAGLGTDRSAGAALVAGPGTGSGGEGNGLGSGRGGNGDGGGGTEAEPINTKLHFDDLPRAVQDSLAAAGQKYRGVVSYDATIGIDGRLAGCRILRSSGNRALDAATCAAASRTFRFRPARDAAGHKVTDSAEFDMTWTVDHGSEADRDNDDDR
jgi:protein TonB